MKLTLYFKKRSIRWMFAKSVYAENLTAIEIIEILEDIKDRWLRGVKHLGREVEAVKVQGWKQQLNCPADFNKIINFYIDIAEKE